MSLHKPPTIMVIYIYILSLSLSRLQIVPILCWIRESNSANSHVFRQCKNKKSGENPGMLHAYVLQNHDQRYVIFSQKCFSSLVLLLLLWVSWLPAFLCLIAHSCVLSRSLPALCGLLSVCIGRFLHSTSCAFSLISRTSSFVIRLVLWACVWFQMLEIINSVTCIKLCVIFCMVVVNGSSAHVWQDGP